MTGIWRRLREVQYFIFTIIVYTSYTFHCVCTEYTIVATNVQYCAAIILGICVPEFLTSLQFYRPTKFNCYDAIGLQYLSIAS